MALQNKYTPVVCTFCHEQFSSHRYLRFRLTQKHNNLFENLKIYDRSLKACNICGVKVMYIQEHKNRKHINPQKIPKIWCLLCVYEGNQHNVNEHYKINGA